MMNRPQRCLWICQSETCCQRGAAELLAAFVAAAAELPDPVEVRASSCLGQCSTGPSARLTPDETWYCRLSPDDAIAIVNRHLRDGIPVTERLNPRFHMRF